MRFHWAQRSRWIQHSNRPQHSNWPRWHRERSPAPIPSPSRSPCRGRPPPASAPADPPAPGRSPRWAPPKPPEARPLWAQSWPPFAPPAPAPPAIAPPHSTPAPSRAIATPPAPNPPGEPPAIRDPLGFGASGDRAGPGSPAIAIATPPLGDAGPPPSHPTPPPSHTAHPSTTPRSLAQSVPPFQTRPWQIQPPRQFVAPGPGLAALGVARLVRCGRSPSAPAAAAPSDPSAGYSPPPPIPAPPPPRSRLGFPAPGSHSQCHPGAIAAIGFRPPDESSPAHAPSSHIPPWTPTAPPPPPAPTPTNFPAPPTVPQAATHHPTTTAANRVKNSHSDQRSVQTLGKEQTGITPTATVPGDCFVHSRVSKLVRKRGTRGDFDSRSTCDYRPQFMTKHSEKFHDFCPDSPDSISRFRKAE